MKSPLNPSAASNDKLIIRLLVIGFLVMFLGSWFSQYQPERMERALRYGKPGHPAASPLEHNVPAEAYAGVGNSQP
jgi:hypothetical protein